MGPAKLNTVFLTMHMQNSRYVMIVPGGLPKQQAILLEQQFGALEEECHHSNADTLECMQSCTILLNLLI